MITNKKLKKKIRKDMKMKNSEKLNHPQKVEVHVFRMKRATSSRIKLIREKQFTWIYFYRYKLYHIFGLTDLLAPACIAYLTKGVIILTQWRWMAINVYFQNFVFFFFVFRIFNLNIWKRRKLWGHSFSTCVSTQHVFSSVRSFLLAKSLTWPS